jgi:energy-coupling factor transport system permease protein
VTALLNALLSPAGATVLLRLPRALPVIGGPLTAEGLVYGAINGLVLAALFAAFALFNSTVPVRDLVQFVPRAFYSLAVVLSIAVTFVPATLEQLRQIREAQAVRGHRVRGLRDWLPLFMPLLVGGLERALRLAEAMTARGFAGESAPRGDPGSRLGSVAGLALLLAGLLLRLGWDRRLAGLGLLAAGALLIVGVLWRGGRRVPHTRCRTTPWTPRAWGTVAGVLLALGVTLTLGTSTRSYSPYPALSLPPFDVGVGLALLGLALPALLAQPNTGTER